MFEIREGTRADASFIAQSQILMAEETEGLALDAETVKLGVAAVFNDPSKGIYYIAQRSEKKVACLLTISEWSDWRNGTVLWIHSVYVIPNERRSGVFREMYRYLKEKVAQDANLRGLRLYVEKKNKIAQKVYQELDMSKEHYELYEWLK